MFSGGEMEKYASRALWRVLWLVIIISLVIGGCIGFLVRPAFAQEHHQMQHSPTDPGHWYDGACCNLNDCAPMDPSEYSVEGGEMIIHQTGERIPLNNIRPSMDEKAHRCIYTYNGMTRKVEGHYCVYMPPST